MKTDYSKDGETHPHGKPFLDPEEVRKRHSKENPVVVNFYSDGISAMVPNPLDDDAVFHAEEWWHVTRYPYRITQKDFDELTKERVDPIECEEMEDEEAVKPEKPRSKKGNRNITIKKENVQRIADDVKKYLTEHRVRIIMETDMENGDLDLYVYGRERAFKRVAKKYEIDVTECNAWKDDR